MIKWYRAWRASLPEFSKRIIDRITLTYFWGVAFGAAVVWRYPEHLPAYLAYIGTPTGVAIAFYAWKARAENVLKIGGSVKQALKIADEDEDKTPNHWG